MIPFKELTESENKALLKFPAIISMLAANGNHKLDAAEKEEALKLSHIKTYACDPLLTDFYQEADKVFENTIHELDKELPAEINSREAALKDELARLEAIVMKLGEQYVKVMHRSMQSFKEYVSQAHHSVLVDFIFPMPIKGLNY